MAPAPTPAPTPAPDTPPTPDQLSQALAIDVYDETGATKTLGELVKGKRTALLFVRHFWCLNCQAYIRHLSATVPPESLPENTQILVIGCGTHHPIRTYASKSASKYPIYTDPTLRLHALFAFQSNLREAPADAPQRDYMRDAGSAAGRVWGGIKGALGSLEMVGRVGPKGLNGGEVVLSADGECEYMWRMRNTVDHTDVATLAKLLGATFEEGAVVGEEGEMKGCEEACGVEGK